MFSRCKHLRREVNMFLVENKFLFNKYKIFFSKCESDNYPNKNKKIFLERVIIFFLIKRSIFFNECVNFLSEIESNVSSFSVTMRFDSFFCLSFRYAYKNC